MKVFLASTSLLPEYGGPAVSVSELATALGRAGIDVGLWAADQSAVTTPLMSKITCVRKLNGTVEKALEYFGKADVLHDNGIWLPHNHRLVGFGKRHVIARIVSTHGTLMPKARNYRRWKKSLAWFLYQRRDLARANCHHVTSGIEAECIERLALQVPIAIIPNGVAIPQESELARATTEFRRSRGNGRKTALFLGRIHPIKGLPMLVEAWARLKPHDWRLCIAGPDEAGHRKAIERLVNARRLDDMVVFAGPISHEKKSLAYAAADLFVLPTHSENFGLAIAEALAHGLPVVTTKGAPWPMLTEHRCGWWVEPDVTGITEGLRLAFALGERELQDMGARGRQLVRDQLGWEHVTKRFVTLYHKVACV